MKKPLVKLTSLAVMLAFSGASFYAVAEDNEAKSEKIKLDAVSVKGILPDRLEAVPGSFDIVDEKAIEERRPFSMQEALNNVPGINVVGENAFGLGINIGVRGMDPRRTSRTLLMEDGMPLFLAPYGDPAAHYTTPIELIQRIEVVKGSGQVLYGPQTVGGMINFVTQPIPTNGFAGSVTAKAGTDDYVGGHINMGYGNERGGFMIDALQNQGDGIRKNHEFEQQDFRIKGQLNLTDRQTLIAKIGYYKEDSNVSETGLSRQEYSEDKYQAASGKNDKFEMERKVAQLQHIFQVDDRMKLSTQAYYVDTKRASMRQVASPGNWDDEEYWLRGNTYSTLAHCPTGEEEVNSGGDSAFNSAQAAQCGGQWRPREFTYWGIEPRLDLNHKLFGVENDLVAGFRYHKEDIDRKGFRGATPAFRKSLSFAKSFTGIDQETYDADDDGIPDGGFDGYFREHIKTEVTAMSYYLQNTFHVGNWSLTPGLRFEDVKTRTNVLWAEGERQGVRGTNNYTKLLPGFGVAWNGVANTTFFGGVHKGFAPPRPDRDLREGDNGIVIDNTKPEESTNWEIGVRTQYFKGINAQATLFHNDFDEIVVQNGSRFDNGGKSLMQGLELAGRVDFGTIFDTPHNFYVAGSYTNLFTAKFKKDAFQTSDDIQEAVDDGDLNSNAQRFCTGDTCQYISSGSRLPYAPRHLASINFGYSHPVGINARIGADYVSEQETTPIGRLSDPITGTAGTIPSYTLVNASVTFKPQGTKTTLFLSGFNLADREYLASRVDGMVAGRGRTVFGGIRYDF
jgi:Fe(3+) dicitrate transport protein